MTTRPPHPGPASNADDDDAPRVLLSVEAAAARLSIGRTMMYGLIKDGSITTVRLGRLRRVPADALTEFTARLAATQRVDAA